VSECRRRSQAGNESRTTPFCWHRFPRRIPFLRAQRPATPLVGCVIANERFMVKDKPVALKPARTEERSLRLALPCVSYGESAALGILRVVSLLSGLNSLAILGQSPRPVTGTNRLPLSVVHSYSTGGEMVGYIFLVIKPSRSSPLWLRVRIRCEMPSIMRRNSLKRPARSIYHQRDSGLRAPPDTHCEHACDQVT
jgi:hypothetical protein